MRRVTQILFPLLALPAISMFGQVASAPLAAPAGYPDNTYLTPSPQDQNQNPDESQNADENQNNDRMLAPPVVSGHPYGTTPTSQERSNYLRGGMTFTSAYGETNLTAEGHPLEQITYTVNPTVSLDETTPRLHFIFNYAPGFTAYERTSARDEADQNASTDVNYRLSPHVTLSAHDSVQKTSNLYNQPNLAAPDVGGGAQQPNFSVVSPIADLLRNSGNVSVSYQFALNGTVGASGTFSNLWYANSAQVPGLNNSDSQGGSVFYTHRLTRKHYIGVTYQYQRLIAHPVEGLDETVTHAVLGYYTLYATTHTSFSVFAGPQYSNTLQPPLLFFGFLVPLPRSIAWNPAAGGSMNWQGRETGLAFSYSHIITGGGGLIGAVHMDSATVSLQQQITKTLSGSLSGGYTQNDVLGTFLAAGTNGHTISGTASLQRQFHQSVNVQLGYTRLHQEYSNVAAISGLPDTSRTFVSVSYQFSRPLGR